MERLPKIMNEEKIYSRDEMYDLFLQWRGITPEYDVICQSCGGSGVKTYSCTSTWRGGIGGQIISTDVCDICWGSGVTNRPGVNLKRLCQ